MAADGDSEVWMRSAHMRLAMAVAPLMIGAALVAGCSSTPSTPAATSPSPTSAAPQVRSECAAVTAAARTLGTDLTAYLAGQGNPDQLRASAQSLADALSQAKTALGADGSRLDAASTAVQQLITALAAQPIQPAAVRAAAQQALSAIGDVISVCTPTSGTPTPTS